jgi:ribosomal protein S14
MYCFVQDEAGEELKKMHFWSHPKNLHTNCIMSGRSRGRHPEFHVNRMYFRALADYGKLCGIMRGTW